MCAFLCYSYTNIIITEKHTPTKLSHVDRSFLVFSLVFKIHVACLSQKFFLLIGFRVGPIHPTLEKQWNHTSPCSGQQPWVVHRIPVKPLQKSAEQNSSRPEPVFHSYIFIKCFRIVCKASWRSSFESTKCYLIKTVHVVLFLPHHKVQALNDEQSRR